GAGYIKKQNAGRALIGVVDKLDARYLGHITLLVKVIGPMACVKRLHTWSRKGCYLAPRSSANIRGRKRVADPHRTGPTRCVRLPACCSHGKRPARPSRDRSPLTVPECSNCGDKGFGRRGY